MDSDGGRNPHGVAPTWWDEPGPRSFAEAAPGGGTAPREAKERTWHVEVRPSAEGARLTRGLRPDDTRRSPPTHPGRAG